MKKSVHPRSFPGVHPGLQQKIRDAEEAEERGETPRTSGPAHRITRPTPTTSQLERQQQLRTTGLVDPAWTDGVDELRHLAEQPAFRAGEDLDEIWDTLSEGDKIRAGAIERFRLEMQGCLRHAALPWQPPHRISGRLDARNLDRSCANLLSELDAFDYLLAPDSRALLEQFVRQTRDLIALCLQQGFVLGINSQTAHAVLQDLVHKLIYQELTSRRRGMGERGIRRAVGNIELAEQVYAQLSQLPGFNPRLRLAMRIIHVHQDLGFTAYAARVSYRGGKLHRTYSTRIFADETNRYRALLTQGERRLVRMAVATHASSEFPFATSLVVALVRAVDHLAPFGPYLVYRHLAETDGASDHLDKMVAYARRADLSAYLEAKEAFRRFLTSDASLHPNLADDIFSALRPVERGSELPDLGELGGRITKVVLDVDPPGTLLATLAPDRHTQAYQALFDCGQDQLLRLARKTHVAAAVLRQGQRVDLKMPDQGCLAICVEA